MADVAHLHLHNHSKSPSPSCQVPEIRLNSVEARSPVPGGPSVSVDGASVTHPCFVNFCCRKIFYKLRMAPEYARKRVDGDQRTAVSRNRL